jgi:deoxyribodipyrimidine photo-lyase
MNLISMNSDLLILNGVDQIPRLIQRLSARYTIITTRCTNQYTKEEIDIIKVWQQYSKVTLVDSLSLVKPELRRLPPTFTEFRKFVESNRAILRSPCDSDNLQLPPVPDIDFGDLAYQIPEVSIHVDERSAFPWSGGETEAKKRVLYYFFESRAVSKYKTTRNGLLGASYSTKFSPYLAFGCISPTWIMAQLKSYENLVEANESTYWVFFELLWRDYFILIAQKYGNLLFHPFGIMKRKISWEDDATKFEAWKNGTTGAPFVDAAMRELSQTGYMSNRARQNVASFLIKDLKLDWTMGAEYFESQLLDYDCCSNYGNWQYLAGVGADPKESRYFNIMKQAVDYDPKGTFIKTWCPELAGLTGKLVFAPWLARGGKEPIVKSPLWDRHVRRIE